MPTSFYPLLCVFPGCDHAAPLLPDADTDGALCDEHAHALYETDAFHRLWQDRDPEP